MKTSCGIIPFRRTSDGVVEFFLGRPGGNYFHTRNLWLYLKGAVENGETWQETAIREFKEESGLPMNDVDENSLIPLGSVQQNPHKIAVAYALYYPNIDVDKCYSNYADDGVTLEIDSYRWMNYEEVCKLTHHAHIGFYDQIMEMFNDTSK